MHFRDLVTRTRSCRRFDGSYRISKSALRDLVELACYAPSAKNLQPLKYIGVTDPDRFADIFSCLSWAGYLDEWSGPEESERPSAYLVMLGDRALSPFIACDSGIAAQTIMLGATNMGLGGCMVGSVDRDRLRQLLGFAEWLDVLFVIALGKPVETIVIDQMAEEEDVRYFRDIHGIHHVPKRMVDDVLLGLH
ncbi:nitroreductase family protein [Chlorobium phaeobacteroides]|uniref:Nitroreductase n=1 Tax=Chlorobium phaeobacteroides (strain DSM 266 / SMG 266 / 2430) TaxID=290317 RepID=A1BEA4_CHLPD|nr:nitroreductase family protein [Chlorobium phaeobacteroides]ABL64731.1 nitroreductase [Chlorobium phaeobacteroides DSM 266]